MPPKPITERPIRAERRIRPAPRQGAERNFFEFEIMHKQQEKNIKDFIKKHGLKLGETAPKYVSKGKAVAKDLVKSPKTIAKEILAKKWLPMHPFKLGDKLIFSKYGGVRKFRRDRATYKELKILNERYAQAVEEMNTTYEAEAKAALIALEAAVSSGKVNWGNRNQYYKEYQEALQNAEIKFVNTSTKIMLEYYNSKYYKKLKKK